MLAVGLVLGLAAAFGPARVLGSLLYEVGTFDPWSYDAVTVLLSSSASPPATSRPAGPPGSTR